MKTKMFLVPLVTVGLAGAMLAAPLTAEANGYQRHQVAQKNQWNGLAVGAAALGIYGLASHQDGLAALGLLGAGYSAIRGSQIDTRCNVPVVVTRRDNRDRDFRKFDQRDNGWNNRNRR